MRETRCRPFAYSILEERWSKLFGANNTKRVDDHVEADTGCGLVVALTTEQAAKRYAGITLPVSYTDKPHGIALQVRVKDIEAVKRILASNNVEHANTARGLAVTAESAGNTIIEFVQP